MILTNENSGLRKNIGYKELAKKYLECYDVFIEDDFVVNMIFMLDEWKKQEGFKLEQLMPSDWDMILKAINVLTVEPVFANN